MNLPSYIYMQPFYDRYPIVNTLRSAISENSAHKPATCLAVVNLSAQRQLSTLWLRFQLHSMSQKYPNFLHFGITNTNTINSRISPFYPVSIHTSTCNTVPIQSLKSFLQVLDWNALVSLCTSLLNCKNIQKKKTFHNNFELGGEIIVGGNISRRYSGWVTSENKFQVKKPLLLTCLVPLFPMCRNTKRAHEFSNDLIFRIIPKTESTSMFTACGIAPSIQR